MSRYHDEAKSALNFDDTVVALGFSSGFPEQRKMSSSPMLQALREAGTSHIYADTASVEELSKTIGAEDGGIFAEVDGNTINQPLLAKVLTSYLDEGDPGAWLHALRRHRRDLTASDALPLLYTIALARAGSDMVKSFGGQRAWEVSLQLHMSSVGDRQRSLRWGRYLRSMVPTCLVKVPFAPHAAECLLTARDLEGQRIPVNLTSTFSARQVVAAALLGGATRTNIFMGRLDQGLEAERLGAHVDLEAQRALRRLRDEAGVETQLIVASLHSWRSLVLTAGCDVYTAPTPVLSGLVEQDELGPEELSSRLETSYEDELGIAADVERRLGRERIARLWKVEPEFVEFLLEYRASDEYRNARDGEAVVRRFEQAGFGDFFHAPSAAEWEELRRGKLPDLGSPITERLALDTLYALLADADFDKHQEEMDREIGRRIE
jgi:transaldolase